MANGIDREESLKREPSDGDGLVELTKMLLEFKLRLSLTEKMEESGWMAN